MRSEMVLAFLFKASVATDGLMLSMVCSLAGNDLDAEAGKHLAAALTENTTLHTLE